MHVIIPSVLLILLGVAHSLERITKERLLELRRWQVECSAQYNETGEYRPGCHPLAAGKACGRVVQDNFLNQEEVQRLISMADRAMGSKDSAGPTIADINTGYVRGPNGLLNMYAGQNRTYFIPDEYSFYREVIERIKSRVEEEFGLQYLYFTAPTFVTRLAGSFKWKPKSMHDEYWHLHVDKNNTQHYDYSGLLYLSDYGQDFTGGLFEFTETNDPTSSSDLIIEPQAGRLFMFSAGSENPHRVRKVLSGWRYVLSFWFTCDESRRFKNFLDGEIHLRFNNQGEQEAKAAAMTAAQQHRLILNQQEQQASSSMGEL